ncbi:type III-B CRISPR module-associated protein Cmr3 [Argonema antarcticum]|uniref:type III-B CRISPR module-associated protein Cmr3 n=1 Tax=Argonema antarcticum TaxID=2942763 RepID=UPI00201267F8|nr:type III-B CRISPR module-associated protein Cmr3 [Argonema antarcticum]MCL1475018.1 type III-B CRISPR module-associated protein Cmr3 [Argonema antarcticum A004/B2]
MLKHLIVIEPLGFLYGSAGRFLSPENLVGRSGTSFPPSAATLSGIFAASLPPEEIRNLQLAGPFWAWNRNPQNFYVPTPFNCLVKDKKIHQQMEWHCSVKDRDVQPTIKNLKWQVKNEKGEWQTPDNDKFEKGTWIAISDWQKLRDRENPPVVREKDEKDETFIWKFVPHLHPRLQEDQRRVVDPEEEQGSLFLENGVQLNPDACLIYLSNTEIKNGWYRFGGEGHLVDLRCEDICPTVTDLLNQDLGRSFALITPAVWGSQRLSYRAPNRDNDDKLSWPDNKCAILTERPTPTRYRLGNSPNAKSGEAKTLSRGRYAIPAGTVYVLEKPLGNWQSWPEEWFPKEGVSFKRWGCGLALPLDPKPKDNEGGKSNGLQ